MALMGFLTILRMRSDCRFLACLPGVYCVLLMCTLTTHSFHEPARLYSPCRRSFSAHPSPVMLNTVSWLLAGTISSLISKYSSKRILNSLAVYFKFKNS